jgi:L-asparagine transporter-like permease
MEKTKSVEERNKLSLVISYLTLRRIIGILGIALPFIMVSGTFLFGGYNEIQGSISSYYYTNMRDVFVGIICAIALFLFSYRGYNLIDNIAGDLGCLFALTLAFFPTRPDIFQPGYKDVTAYIHLISAALFFCVLIFFSLVLFPRRDKNQPFTKQKKQRNKVFRVCGYTILGCMVLIFLYFVLQENFYPGLIKYDIVFWLETVALFAFGISWLVKGQFILKDIKES